MRQAEDSHRLEHRVHRSLLAGLAVSGLLLVLGLGVALSRGGPRPEGPPPSLAAVLRGALRGDGVDLLDLGLLSLIGTPVLRVAVLAVGWMAAGERRFAAVAVVVLGLLGASLALGLG
jgi:uncharacterized membrane protein